MAEEKTPKITEKSPSEKPAEELTRLLAILMHHLDETPCESEDGIYEILANGLKDCCTPKLVKERFNEAAELAGFEPRPGILTRLVKKPIAEEDPDEKNTSKI